MPQWKEIIFLPVLLLERHDKWQSKQVSTVDQKQKLVTGKWHVPRTFLKVFHCWPWWNGPANYCSPVPHHVSPKHFCRYTKLWCVRKNCGRTREICEHNREKVQKAPSVCFWVKPRRLSKVIYHCERNWLHWGSHYSANPLSGPADRSE